MPRRSSHLSPRGYRWCAHCQRDLIEDAFRRLKSGDLDAWCKLCRRAYTKEKRQEKHPPKLCPWCGGAI
jgi:hypothetical protein